MKYQTGYALLVTLIVVFVLTLIIVSQTDSVILGLRSVVGMKRYQQLFYCANDVLVQTEDQLLGKTSHLSTACIDFAIQQSIRITQQRVDPCGNKEIDIQASTQLHSQMLILQARDIFARVPVLKHCEALPRFQRVGWIEK